MTTRIHKQFIATVAAVAIAITGFSAIPARADNDDAARALAAILGLAVIGAVIADKRKDKARARDHDRYRPGNRHQPRSRPLPPRVNRKLLPQECLFSFRTRNGGTARIFGQRCLNNNYRHVRSLPRDCARQIETRRGYRYGYGARCLRNHGYQLARR